MTETVTPDPWAGNALVAQARSLGDLVREQVPILSERVHKVVPVPVEYSMRQLFLVGCGDSVMAAAATQQAFRRFTGIPTAAEDAMTFSRFTSALFSGEYPRTPTVVAISNSGEVARVVEAARNARLAGGYVISLVGNPQSTLARSGDVVIQAKAAKFPSAPGTRSYLVTVLTLLLFAIRLGEVRGKITMVQAKALRKELTGLGDVIDQVLTSAEPTLGTLATQWAGVASFDFLGSGPDSASARFGAAKIMEATGIRAGDVDIEEFFHLNYFLRDPSQIATVVIGGPDAPAKSRIRELAPVLAHLERPTLWLGSTQDRGTSLPLPAIRTEFSPVVQPALLSLFAGMLLQVRGEVPGRGHTGAWALSAGGATTRTSHLELHTGGPGSPTTSEGGQA